MTARELTLVAEAYPWHLTAYFLALPIGSALLGICHGRKNGGLSPWKYLYSAIVYLACVPGLLAGVLIGYALFFTKQNLMDVDLLVFVMPVVSMTVTLILVSKRVDFDQVPGFDRLSGLMVMIAVTFILALAIIKTRIWLVFGDSVLTLVVLVLGLFALLRWGAYMLFRRKEDPKIERPSLFSRSR